MQSDIHSGKTSKAVRLEVMLIKAYRAVTYPVYNVLDYLGINFFKCRYTPSCSHYAEEAIKKYGVKKGSIMAVKRILRCSPYFPSGEDPVE